MAKGAGKQPLCTDYVPGPPQRSADAEECCTLQSIHMHMAYMVESCQGKSQTEHSLRTKSGLSTRIVWIMPTLEQTLLTLHW